MNISNNLENAAFYFPNRPALSEAGNEITYSEFNDRANLVATGLLASGVKPGEHDWSFGSKFSKLAYLLLRRAKGRSRRRNSFKSPNPR